MIPDRDACFTILKEHDVEPHIVAHSMSVERVALYVARLHMDRGGGGLLDLSLISAGALLHDIAKIRAMETGVKHSDMGADMMCSLGLFEVAPLVRQHVLLDEYNRNGAVTEAELVNYGDKRVTHDQIVTLTERFDDLYIRYGSKSPEAMEHVKEIHRRSLDLEKKLFRSLSVAPGDLVDILRNKEEEVIGFHSG
ncbi:MAG: HDIG domain-containing protein [Deltaproteobacteria bacterium]|nr:HDIG domain-containing protein [Candidatus Zymogenaceae bacterium]